MSGLSKKTRKVRLLVGVLSPALVGLTLGACGRLKDPNAPPSTGAVAALGTKCGSGKICTVAGTGVAGDGEDGQKGLDTRLYLPQDTTFGPDGKLGILRSFAGSHAVTYSWGFIGRCTSAQERGSKTLRVSSATVMPSCDQSRRLRLA